MARFRRYKYPYDWGGYSADRYPPSIGLDPDKVKCNNCRHYNKSNSFCLLQKRKTSPNNRCRDFGRKGL